MVTQRNFLDIYRYQSWGGQGELPLFEHGQRFQPAQILLKEVSEGTGGRGHAQLACRLRRWSTSGSAAPMAACWPQKQPVRCFCLSRAHHHAAANPINCLNTNPACRATRSRRRASPSATSFPKWKSLASAPTPRWQTTSRSRSGRNTGRWRGTRGSSKRGDASSAAALPTQTASDATTALPCPAPPPPPPTHLSRPAFLQQQIERGYATKDEATMQFSPTPLGEALISAYRKARCCLLHVLCPAGACCAARRACRTCACACRAACGPRAARRQHCLHTTRSACFCSCSCRCGCCSPPSYTGTLIASALPTNYRWACPTCGCPPCVV